MCERALQHKDANVNILLDFVTDLTSLTPLFLGHKPTSVMTDSRSPEQFDKIKANKDSLTFSLNIYKTTPMLQLQITTSISSWVPCVHLINNIILFATADELLIHKDITYGKLKKDSDKVTEEGEFVSLMLSAAKPPFRTRLTIIARRNGFCSLIIADDLRQETKADSLLGLVVMLPTSELFGNFENKC